MDNMRWIKCIVNIFFWQNFPLSKVFEWLKHSAQQWFDEFTIKIFNLCQKTYTKSSWRTNTFSLQWTIWRKNKKKKQITYITNKNRFEQTTIENAKMMQFFWFLLNFFSSAHKKIRESIFMRFIFFEIKRIRTISVGEKNHPHFVSVIGKHLQILRDCDFTTAWRWNVVLEVWMFFFDEIWKRTDMNVTLLLFSPSNFIFHIMKWQFWF